MKREVFKALKKYAKEQELDLKTRAGKKSAVRDVLTDCFHIANDLGVDATFDIMDIVEAAYEVYEQEREEKELAEVQATGSTWRNKSGA